MGGETVTETWFSNIWRNSRKSISLESQKPVIGILAFEISRLMSKVVSLWQCISDHQIARLKEEIVNSVGIQKLVSEDNDYVMDLALAEILENFSHLANSVAMLGKKCMDPTYHNLERVFDDLTLIDLNWNGWQYRLKKMERKVKKMERFVAVTEQLYQELEVLAEQEQSLRRVQAGADLGKVKLFEFQQKVVWQRQEVKNLRMMSPWVRTYDYVVRLLLRSLFTIVERIKFVYGIANVEGSDVCDIDNDDDCLSRSNSFSTVMQVHTSEKYLSSFAAPLGRSFSNLGFTSSSKKKKLHARSQSSLFCGKQPQMKTKLFTPVGFKGCMTGGIDSPVIHSFMPPGNGYTRSNNASDRDTNAVPVPVPVFYCSVSLKKFSSFKSKRQLLNAPPSTLGHAGLALHSANIVILIEKLASAPHLISLDARDDLYSMLTASIRSSLRAKLKGFSRTSASAMYDAEFAREWSLAVARILEWLSPLAHNMIRWHSERNFERQRMIHGSNVLLVQTLYFANQAETEAAIVELLLGLNYLSRFGRDVNEARFQQPTCGRVYNGCMLPKGNTCYNLVDHAS